MKNSDIGFLAKLQFRPIKLAASCPYVPVGLALGQGNQAIEVVVCTSKNRPDQRTIRTAWKDRNKNRAAPLLFVVLYGDKAALCGPAGSEPPVRLGLDPGQVERLCLEALEQPDRHAALRSLRVSLPAAESELAGIINQGFLATHELRVGAPKLPSWDKATEISKKILGNHGEQLLKSLGFQIDPCDNVTSILKAKDQKLALAVLLNPAESPEAHTERFSGLSPVSYALSVADRENLPYVIVCQRSEIRLYPTKIGVGVGRRGRTETYVGCHTGLLRDSEAAYLWLLFSAGAISDGGTLSELLEESQRFAGNLAEGLRDRIYEHVVPQLAKGIAIARGIRKPKASDLAQTYEMTMMVLFRLLFIAYAEDKDLLPYKQNQRYKNRSLKTKAQELLTLIGSDATLDEATSLWEEVCMLFRAVESGNKDWGVPAYNGGMFSSDPEESPVGALLTEISLPNSVFGGILRDLLLIQASEGWGPVDFRSLGVREFGTVYEGLLESELAIAETDLSVDKKNTYRPAKAKDTPTVHKGEYYLHNRSGARKSSGAYFTKQFAVEHLLDKALEPALIDHLGRLDKLSDDEAAEKFFDFRVADIAMGSGHFLIAAIDRVERAFTGYIAKRQLSGVKDELSRLRGAAIEALDDLSETVELEDTQILRRLIARRCIYGVDINPISVQLARLGIWIHTFVAGLPLSLLDHTLVCGNSLVGIGRLEEIKDVAKQEHTSDLFLVDPVVLIGEATEPLRKLARLADMTVEEVRRARKAMIEAEKTVAPARALCDIVTATRIDGKELSIDLDEWDSLRKTIVGSTRHKKALRLIDTLQPLHLPIAFPEVFLREREGFDVILGNPPWEEATVEEDAFWARHFPGMRSLPQREQEALKKKFSNERPDLRARLEEEVDTAELMRKALISGAYPGMGTGDPDLYKAFCWRFWNLLSDFEGTLGVVLPRSALAAKGSSLFRDEILTKSSFVNVLMILNNQNWFFEDVHPQYTIALVGIRKNESEETDVFLSGPYASLEKYTEGHTKAPAKFTGEDVLSWNETASLPLLPSDESVEVFAQLRKAPPLDLNEKEKWRARPHRELDATNDKGLMDVDSESCPDGFWPVYKGESFDIWKPDTGKYYAWADPKVMLPALQQKRLRANKNKRSAFSEFDRDWALDKSTLPCHFARIAFRDITNRTNRRTVIATLIPPNVFITNKGPYLMWPRGDQKDMSYLLGVLSSLSLDWYARRFVELSMNFFIFNPFPVPRVETANVLKQRIVELAGRLACPDDRFKVWAASVGVDCGPLEDTVKEDMIHELDAVVAHLYGLKQKHLIHIFETFHAGWNYSTRLEATLKHYKEWKKRL